MKFYKMTTQEIDFCTEDNNILDDSNDDLDRDKFFSIFLTIEEVVSDANIPIFNTDYIWKNFHDFICYYLQN